MKLYATVTSERASKGQGGNKYIETIYCVGSASDSKPIARFYLSADEFEDKYVIRVYGGLDGSKLLYEEYKEKGKQ